MGADALHHLSVDIETYSDVDIGKAGLYKYAQSPAFRILLFAYSLDGAPVQVVDLTQTGGRVPDWIFAALTDADTIKHAYNASFEWYCLSRHFNFPFDLSQWRCTMLHGMYLGYPGGLDACGKALGLPQDKQKMGIGKSLIRYFCVPCKPTKANGGRTRNLPHHDPAKWELFKTYNAQDVVTEMEIESRLSKFPVPDEVQKQWELDLTINARGVAVDRALVASAQAVDAQVRQEYIREAQGLTGLENPNSVAQLTSWLTEQTGEELPDLSKGTVAQLLKSDLPAGSTRRLLEIRQELGKTSNKKYDAIEKAVCDDGRVRGLLQFYGANRTGRWCLTGDHEVLTPSGWARLDQWTGGKIACWAPSTEYISFQTAESVSFPYEGEMYRITGQRCEQICTPDHKMAVLQKDGSWGPQTMESLNMHRFTMPFTGRRLTNPSRSGTELRVLIMTQADGHYTETGDVRYHFKKARKIERCKRLLRSAGIPFISSEYTNGVAGVVIKSRFVPIWLRQFRDKAFGWWLLDEDAEVVFDELPYWDAYNCGPNSIQYTSTNKQNVEVLQALAVLSGRSATMLAKVRQDEKWNPAYVLNIWNTPGHGTSIRREQITKEPFTGMVYCASTKTGYFLVRRNGKVWATGNSGRIVQPQNLPRTYIPGDLLPMARDLVKTGNADALKWIFGSVPDTLSQLIRTALVASPGNVLIDADFSAIEARVIAWLADEEWVLDVFRDTGKIYEATASRMFGIPVEKIKKGNPEYAYRQKGKVATLALGYQGGVGAMRTMDTSHELDSLSDAEVQELVDLWRRANPNIVKLWGWVEAAARAAVVEGRTSFLQHGIVVSREVDASQGLDFLSIQLPSGRKLYYPQPAITQNRFGRPSISYMGQNQTTKKWERIESYGGKLVENCLVADTPVLTDRGVIPIVLVQPEDKLWDGLEWVSHDGLVAKGTRMTVDVDGVHMTPDHKVLTDSGWICASSCERYNRIAIGLPDGYKLCRVGWKEILVEYPVRLWEDIQNAGQRVSERQAEILRLHERRSGSQSYNYAWAVQASDVPCVALNEGAVSAADSASLEELRRPQYKGLRPLVGELREFLRRHVSVVCSGFNPGSTRRKRRLLSGKLPVGIRQSPGQKQAVQSGHTDTVGQYNGIRGVREIRDRRYYAAISHKQRLPGKFVVHETGRNESVYDLKNAGPRHRFTVISDRGPMLVHNCVQAVARDCLAEAITRLEAAGYPVVFHIHDEIVVDAEGGKRSLEEMERLMAVVPEWAPGLPLNADGWVNEFFKKD